MATGEGTYKHSDGKSVDVTLAYTVAKNDVLYVEGILGIANDDGDSDDMIALNVDQAEYFFTVPSTLTVVKGATVWVDITDLTGHKIDESAYAITAVGANHRRLFRATVAKDGNNNVPGIFLGGLGLT